MPSDDSLLRGDPDMGAFTEIRLRGGRVTAVAAVNRPADCALARRVLAEGPAFADRAALQDPAVPLNRSF